MFAIPCADEDGKYRYEKGLQPLEYMLSSQRI